MRIVQINSLCGYGCTGRIMAGISNVLKDNGHDCLNVYSRNTAPEELQSYKINSRFDTYLNVLHTRLTDKDGFGTKKPTLKLLDVIENYKPDLIQLHNLHGYYINIKLLFEYLAERKIPVIWTLHDEWSYTGHCPYTLDCDKWKTGCHNCVQRGHHPKSLFVDNSVWNYKEKRRLFQAVDNLSFVTPSSWLGDRLKQSFLKEKDVYVIHNGINTSTFKPIKSEFKKKYNIENKFMLLGVSSGWYETKGLKDFITLSEKLSEKFVVVIVGNTDMELPENIIHISHTDSVDELAEIYSAADVFVNPTTSDNFPTVNIEALACGTPIITYDTGGSPEAIDNTCGIVVKQNDVDEIIRILNNFDKYNISGENARMRSLDFDENKKYKEYIDLYEKKIGIGDNIENCTYMSVF